MYIIANIHPINVYIQTLLCMCTHTQAHTVCVFLGMHTASLDMYTHTGTHTHSLNFTHPLFSSIKIPNG